MSATEFRLLWIDAEKLGYKIEVEKDGYRLVYEGSSRFLLEEYPWQFFTYQDSIEPWLEEMEHKIAIYRRNLRLAKKVGEIEDGKLPAFAWPGGAPIYYWTKDGEMECADCAENDEEVIGADVYEEGPEVECGGWCGKMLESAYGDPEEKE